jgi:hypothetical protein
MRIRNNKGFNIKIMAAHGTVGAAGAGAITVPAGATLELTDAEWKPFANAAKVDLDCENLEITKAPALSEEEVTKRNAEQLAAAEKLISDNKAAEKAKADAAKANK